MKNIQILTPRDPKTNMNSTSSSLAEDTDLCFFIFNKFQKQFKNAYKLIPSTLRLAPSSISSGAASHKVYNRLVLHKIKVSGINTKLKREY